MGTDLTKPPVLVWFRRDLRLSDQPALSAAAAEGPVIPAFVLVDAGMRQLWATGWMHNRVRMIAASFLIKHLLIDWREGERWFWDTLVDADYANNGVNWQWVAGCGVDAHLSDAEIHDPADHRRGRYPAKLIGHREARERALTAYRQMKPAYCETRNAGPYLRA